MKENVIPREEEINIGDIVVYAFVDKNGMWGLHNVDLGGFVERRTSGPLAGTPCNLVIARLTPDDDTKKLYRSKELLIDMVTSKIDQLKGINK